MDSYSPHLAVSEHAVQRFRERARDFLEEGGHLSDAAVSYQLDFAIWDAMEDEERVYDIVDSAQPSKLVHIENEKWGSLWALVRENKNPRYAQRWAVITCLTDWQMTQNALDGRYSGNVPRLPQFARHFETAARPRLVAQASTPAATPPPPPPAPAVAPAAAPPQPEPSPAASVPPATAPSDDMASAAVAASAGSARSEDATATARPPSVSPQADDRRLIAWPDPSTGGRRFEELPRAEVIARIVALCASGVTLAQIEVWRPSAVRFDVE